MKKSICGLAEALRRLALPCLRCQAVRQRFKSRTIPRQR